MSERTTDLSKLREGALFTWGKVRAIHTVGRYDIVEYNPRKVQNSVLMASSV